MCPSRSRGISRIMLENINDDISNGRKVGYSSSSVEERRRSEFFRPKKVQYPYVVKLVTIRVPYIDQKCFRQKKVQYPQVTDLVTIRVYTVMDTDTLPYRKYRKTVSVWANRNCKRKNGIGIIRYNTVTEIPIPYYGIPVFVVLPIRKPPHGVQHCGARTSTIMFVPGSFFHRDVCF